MDVDFQASYEEGAGEASILRLSINTEIVLSDRALSIGKTEFPFGGRALKK